MRTFAVISIMSGAALVLAAHPNSAAAQAHGDTTKSHQNPRWAAVQRVFGRGEAEGRYFRVNLPRSDLHVHIASDTLDPGLEFTSYIGFMPRGTGATTVMAMGEVVLREDEVSAAFAEARRQGVRVTALHNHLLGESPRITYMHVMAEGPADTVATKLRAVFAATATPLDARGAQDETASTANWSVIDGVLGKHSEAEGAVAEYVFPRRERLTVHGVSVESVGTLETASEVVFQKLESSRVATAGELYLLPGEVQSVMRALDEHGLHVTALHNHMLDDGPPHYWVHWYATGDGASLARGIAAALAHMNSAQKAAHEE